ncbi:MAG TPA: hypothetical protein VFJ51_00495 [Nitrososphaeraceae archaeon]|nr:hypothetical protein [Nitrososphaeraceae archaeon]
MENGSERRRHTDQKDNSIPNANPNKTDLCMTQNNIEIGRTIVSGGYPNTLDSFWFALADDITVKLRKLACRNCHLLLTISSIKIHK